MNLLKKVVPIKFKLAINLISNYIEDLRRYWKFSTVSGVSSVNNKECQLILNYHSLEKGMLFSPIKPRFGKEKVINLHYYLNDLEIKNNVKKSQIFVGYKVMVEYYELHQEKKIDISDYYTEIQYQNYKNLANDVLKIYKSAKLDYTKENFYKNSKDFYDFSFSRKSVRSFTGKLISHEKIKQVINLANNAPSVCNRQASKVYLVENKELVKFCLELQGGLTGYTEKINQILILTSNREYFYSIGERNQLYIDGGIYLMNLLYSLHYHQIACCPANWGKSVDVDNKIREKIKIKEQEQIICIVAIGDATDNFNVTLSYRRHADEVLEII